MKKSLRLSETWFNRGLWLVSLVFASFLIGLGGLVVGNLPGVDKQISLNDFIDKTRSEPIRAALRKAEYDAQEASLKQQQAQLQRQATQTESQNASESFSNWIATRHATQQPGQDAELVARTQQLDALKSKELVAMRALEAQDQALLDAQQTAQREQSKLSALEAEAQQTYNTESRHLELRVFLTRLAITLPLLLLAGWLFNHKRKSMYWPFVWGFIFFAGFAFFVELVPYLPSYGGYVRYIVGILITVLVGRQAIVALSRYLEKQKLAEELPSAERQKELSYDTALTRLSKNVCPGCERAVDLKNPAIDFCSHCGMGLFEHCKHCDVRKSSFTKFCYACGCAEKVGGSA